MNLLSSGGNLWLHGAPSTEHRACSKSVSDGSVRDIHTSWSHSVALIGLILSEPDPDTGPADGLKAFDGPVQLSYSLKKPCLWTFFLIFRLKRKHILNKQVLHEKIKLVLGKYVCFSIRCLSSC